MSYKTYTTEGIVCGSTHSNTSDKSFLIFTREAGMVFAHARSVREERSKQRFALQDFSHIRVSLVKGKSGWRIGSVESLGNSFLMANSREERGCVSFLITQLRKYVHGEIPLTNVYDDMVVLLKDVSVYAQKWPRVQRIFMLRLFAELGYIARSAQWKTLIDEPLGDALTLYDPALEKRIDAVLHAAAEASHL